MAGTYVFVFELDRVIVRDNILSAIMKRNGISDLVRMEEGSSIGEVPFRKYYNKKLEMLDKIPVEIIKKEADKLPLNEKVAQFIRSNRDRCYIATDNPADWVENIIERLDMKERVFAPKSVQVRGVIISENVLAERLDIFNVIKKPMIAIGNDDNDAEMVEKSEIGIGFGSDGYISGSVLECASYAAYSEDTLINFLGKFI